MTPVTLLKVPGMVALGLLASLAVHAALFGGSHAMGGEYHALLVQAALTGALTLLGFFGVLAWSGSRGVTEGSVLAGRLRERLPGFGTILLSTLFWYAAAEAFEPHHAAASPLPLLLALAAISWLAQRLARAAVDTIADAVIAILRTPFSSRTPTWSRRPRLRPTIRRTHWARRHFARPPPNAILCV